MKSMKKTSKSKSSPLRADDQWEVENDLRTFLAWKEIKSDPKRLAKVKALAKEKLEAMASAASMDSDGDSD